MLGPLPVLEFLSSISSSFMISGDFNIHVDTTSRDSIKFLDTLLSCDMTQHANKPTHIHGHILDLLLTPSDFSAVSNVLVAEFFPDYALVMF